MAGSGMKSVLFRDLRNAAGWRRRRNRFDPREDVRELLIGEDLLRERHHLLRRLSDRLLHARPRQRAAGETRTGAAAAVRVVVVARPAAVGQIQLLAILGVARRRALRG